MSDLQRALSANDKHILVTASAGSGKTYTITEKIACLLSAGEEPGMIKVITYTNAAADEMRERLAARLNPATFDGLFIGTLNSFALKTLREEANSPGFDLLNKRGWLGYVSELWRLVEDDQVDMIIKSVRDSLKPKKVTLKSLRLGLGADLNAPTKLSDKTRLARQEMRRANYVTQDDLVEMLADGASVVADRISHLIVDEAQDLPHSHRRFITNLIDHGVSTFICQDDAQAIFGFLSKRQEQMGFEQGRALKGVRYDLTSNFRSARRIVDLANRVRGNIASAGGCSDVTQAVERDLEGEIVELEFEMLCDAQYNESVPQRILDEVAFEFASSESCALLCRTWSDVALFRGHLIKLNLCESVDMSLSLKLPQNRALLGLAEIIARGSMSISDLEAIASYKDLAPKGSVFERTGEIALLAIATYQSELSRTLADVVDDFLGDELPAWQGLGSIKQLSYLEQAWSEFGGGYSPLLAKANEEVADVDDLLSRSMRLSKAQANPRKTVTTVHQAKGLEYDTVIIYGVSDGIYPNKRDKTDALLHESGRTLYTAITRARDRLVMLRPTMLRNKPRERSSWLV
jgi:superfamily I DNA/RNA helicase